MECLHCGEDLFLGPDGLWWRHDALGNYCPSREHGDIGHRVEMIHEAMDSIAR
jgi:hypothetical protein